MRELVIAFGLFLFIEGILYALFPAKMKSMLKKLELVKDSQLRSGGLIFAVIGFVSKIKFGRFTPLLLERLPPTKTFVFNISFFLDNTFNFIF